MNIRSAAAISILLAAGTARAQTLNVEVFRTGTSTWNNAITGGYATVDGSNNVTISSKPADGTSFRIYFNGGLGNLGLVEYDVNDVVVLRISPDGGPLDLLNPASDGANNWNGLAGDHADQVIVAAGITGNLTGSLTCRRLIQFLVGGDATADTTAFRIVDPCTGHLLSRAFLVPR